MHQRPGFTPEYCCQFTVKQLYNFPCTKDLASRHGFDVRHLSDSRIIFHAPKTWLHIRFLCQTTVRQLYNLHAPKTWLKGYKDLVSSQGFNVGIQSNIRTVFHASKTWLQTRVLMSGYCTTVISLSCIKDGTIKDLVSSQAFNIGIQSNI